MSDIISELEAIPGTYVMSPKHSRAGYHLNMFCKSLDVSSNRDAFRENPSSYLDGFKLSDQQREAVESREWLEMLRLGGNIYYTFKLAIFDGLGMQGIGGKMSGVSEEEFRNMMINGGRQKGDPHTT